MRRNFSEPKQPAALRAVLPGRYRTLFTLLCVVLASFPSFAQKWEPMPMVTQAMLNAGISPGGEGGQWLRAITISPSDASFMMMATDVGGVYRSLNGGSSWQICMSGWNARGGNDFAIDPRNPNRVIGIGANSSDYGSANGLYLSTNKAASWTQTKQMGTGNSGDVEYDKSSYDAGLGYCKTAYYSGPNGLWKTTDGGSSWNQIKTGFSKAILKTHPTQGYVYVASNEYTDHGFWRSTDGGANFTQITSDYVLGLDVIDSQPDNVYISRWFKVHKSTDAGLTFSYIGNDYPNDGLPDGVPIKNIKVSPANANNMACWYEGADWQWKRYYSNDGGKKWAESTFSSDNTFLPINVRNGLFAWHPTNGSVVFNLGGDAVVKSTNGGQTYTWSNNGENAVMVGGMFNISRTTPTAACLAFQDYNAAVTTNGGTAWTYSNPSGNAWGGYCYGGYAVDASVMWLGNAPSWGGTRELKVSRNGGATWNVMQSGGSNITFSGPDVSYSDPVNSNVGFASNWRSTDKGVSWSAMSGCDGVYTSNPAGAKELYGKKGNDIVKSTDQGATWQYVTTVSGGFSDLAYDQVRNRLYVASEDQVKKFENGTWATLATPADQYGSTRVSTVAVDPVDPAIVYAGSHRDIYACNNAIVRSVDAGTNWTNLTVNGVLGADPGGPREVQCIRVHPTTRYAWVSGQCYGMWKIAPPGGTAAGFSGTYKVTARHSGKALDVAGISTANGANVHQWTYNGGANQQWIITDVGGGYYKLISKHSGKSLDVNGGTSYTANGVNIHQWEYLGQANQQWKIEDVGGGYHKITARHSGKCVDVDGGTSDGTNVHQWEYLGQANQQWKLEQLSSSTSLRLSAETLPAEESPRITVYPVPASDRFTIRYQSAVRQQVRLRITDMLSRTVEESSHALQAGSNEFTLPATRLKTGLYVIQIRTGGKTETRKLLISR